MTTTGSRQQLMEKLFAVMQAIDHIEKDGYNDFHKYKFASERAIKTAVREHLLIQKVLYHYEAETITHTGDLTTVTGFAVFTDITSGEALRIPFGGDGSDKGDKGVYKAITGAVKYSLLNTFLIPTGDDAESDTSVDRNANQGHPASVFRAKEVTPPLQTSQTPIEPSMDELNDIFGDAEVPNNITPTHKEICPKCKGPMTYKEGIGKQSGKPFKSWNCDDWRECKHVIWLK